MVFHKSKAAWAVGLYLLLVMIAAIIPFITQEAQLGMFFATLTLPWSFLFVLLINPFLSETVLKSETLGIAIGAVAALLNAGIIYVLFNSISKASKYKEV
jgi:prepilin signal peptidase PulO-like enzyme (type II secretory pathway)